MPTAFVMLAFTFPLWCSCRLDTLHHQYLTLTLPSFLTSCLKLLSLSVLDPSLRKWQQSFIWHQDVGTAVPANTGAAQATWASSWRWFITELSPARRRWKRCRQRKERRNDSIFPFSQSKNRQNLPLFLKPADGASSFGSYDKCPEASEHLGYKNRITACQNLSIFWIFCPKQQKIE